MNPLSPKAIAGRLFSIAGYEVRRRSRAWDRLLGLVVRPFRTVIDVGANTGQFAREAASRFPGAAIHCFEPQPDVFRDLNAWAQTQRNVQAYNVALGADDGVLEMHVHVDHHFSSSLLGSTPELSERYPQTARQRAVHVPVRRLDAFIAAEHLELAPEVLLKMDVQGYEDRVLAGASASLGHVDACILEINLDPLYAGQATFHGLCSRLDASGLQYAGNLEQHCAPDGHVIFLDAVFVRRAR